MTTTVKFGKDKYHLQSQMERWCVENIDRNLRYQNWVASEPLSWQGLGTWCMSSKFGTTFFYFKQSKDATAFVLRWS